jgi:hypothetical protein
MSETMQHTELPPQGVENQQTTLPVVPEAALGPDGLLPQDQAISALRAPVNALEAEAAQLDSQITEAKGRTLGFRATAENHVEANGRLRDLRNERDENEQRLQEARGVWNAFGGEELDQAQAEVDAFNFRTTAEQKVEANGRLRNARSNIYAKLQDAHNAAQANEQVEDSPEGRREALLALFDEVYNAAINGDRETFQAANARLMEGAFKLYAANHSAEATTGNNPADNADVLAVDDGEGDKPGDRGDYGDEVDPFGNPDLPEINFDGDDEFMDDEEAINDRFSDYDDDSDDSGSPVVRRPVLRSTSEPRRRSEGQPGEQPSPSRLFSELVNDDREELEDGRRRRVIRRLAGVALAATTLLGGFLALNREDGNAQATTQHAIEQVSQDQAADLAHVIETDPDAVERVFDDGPALHRMLSWTHKYQADHAGATDVDAGHEFEDAADNLSE